MRAVSRPLIYVRNAGSTHKTKRSYRLIHKVARGITHSCIISVYSSYSELRQIDNEVISWSITDNEMDAASVRTLQRGADRMNYVQKLSEFCSSTFMAPLHGLFQRTYTRASAGFWLGGQCPLAA